MTSATNPKTIVLTGDYGCQQEAEANGAITPGHLIERSGSKVVVHATGGGNANAHFALEYAMTGQDIDDAYASGDNVLFITALPGQHIYALLADGQDVSAGDLLTSNGDGTLKASTTGDVVIAQALEDVAASGSDARIKVEVFTPQTEA